MNEKPASLADKIKDSEYTIVGTEKEEFHYFCSCAYGWTTGKTLYSCLDRMRIELFTRHQQAEGGNVMVFLVNLPESTIYDISMYAPVLPEEKVKFVGVFTV